MNQGWTVTASASAGGAKAFARVRISPRPSIGLAGSAGPVAFDGSRLVGLEMAIQRLGWDSSQPHMLALSGDDIWTLGASRVQKRNPGDLSVDLTAVVVDGSWPRMGSTAG